MTIHNAYIEQLKRCQSLGISYDIGGHYKTRIDFGGKSVYVNPNGEDVIRYQFIFSGCMKTRTIRKDGKVVKTLHFHKDKLPVYGRITNKRNLKALLYKYLLFLRCDGIENAELLKAYLLQCLSTKFEFWRKQPVQSVVDGNHIVEYKDWALYEPDYADIEKMVNGLIASSIKTCITDEIRETFIIRTCCVVNPTVTIQPGSFRDKHKREIRRDAKAGQRLSTDNKIRSLYDPELSDKENACRIGISARRLQEWKAAHREMLEPLHSKIARMYDPSLSLRKNADIIGCSVNSVKKYAANMAGTLTVIDDETEEAWVTRILEDAKKNNYLWDEPTSPRKKDVFEEDDEMSKFLDSLGF